MKNIPEKIYLNIGFKPDVQDDFKTLEEVSWSKDITDGNDIEYTLSKKGEIDVLNKLDNMCAESLSPETFEKWETVKNGLLLSRKDLGQLLPTPSDAEVQEQSIGNLTGSAFGKAITEQVRVESEETKSQQLSKAWPEYFGGSEERGYEPYSDEWVKEIMKMPKKAIIEILLRPALIKNQTTKLLNVVERFGDNGAHSHWELINHEGEILWMSGNQ